MSDNSKALPDEVGGLPWKPGNASTRVVSCLFFFFFFFLVLSRVLFFPCQESYL